MAQPQMTQPKDNCFWALVYGFLGLIVLGGIYDYKYTPHHPIQDGDKQQSHLQGSLQLDQVEVSDRDTSQGPLLTTFHKLPLRFEEKRDFLAQSLPAADITTGTIYGPKQSFSVDGPALQKPEFKTHLRRLKTSLSDASDHQDNEIFISTKVKRSFSLAEDLRTSQGKQLKKISFSGQSQALVGATQMPKIKPAYHQYFIQSQDLISLSQCQDELNALLSNQPVQFASGQHRTSRRAFKRLRAIAKRLRRCDFNKIVIEGHSDISGNAAQNKKISSRRAVHIVHLLVRFGVQHHKLQATGFGATRPLAPNDTAANRARNRRISIRLI